MSDEKTLMSHREAKRLAGRLAKTDMGLPFNLPVVANFVPAFWRLKKEKLAMLIQQGRVAGQGSNKAR